MSRRQHVHVVELWDDDYGLYCGTNLIFRGTLSACLQARRDWNDR